MLHRNPTRRDFLRTSVGVASATLAMQLGINVPSLAQTTRRSAIDQVFLGKTGIKLSRLGIGTGVNNGVDNLKAGKDEFIKVNPNIDAIVIGMISIEQVDKNLAMLNRILAA
jgi:hypothetical protein